VADCVRAMREAVTVPVTVKCRIGVDDQDTEQDLERFAECMVGAGVEVLIVHARKAWLKGLSPKENRDVPPLDYPRVYRLGESFPQLSVIINGGISDAGAAQAHLAQVPGVMLGRAAYQHPWILAELESRLWGAPLPDRVDVLRRLRPYVEAEMARGVALKHIVRHVLGLFHGAPGARRFRRLLSEGAHRDGADWSLVERAIDALGPGARAAA
jgi:tRNA-dihydrouridine synthase A